MITKEQAIAMLCEALDNDIYLPLKEILRKLSDTFDFGYKKERYKASIENIINAIEQSDPLAAMEQKCIDHLKNITVTDADLALVETVRKWIKAIREKK